MIQGDLYESRDVVPLEKMLNHMTYQFMYV